MARALPETPTEVLPDHPWVLEQSGGSRILLQVEPSDADIEAWAGAMRIPLREGPGNSWLVPEEDVARQLELRSDVPLEIRWWRETSLGEPQAWDRYERRFHRWARVGGELPPAPSAIPALEVEWLARRQAMVAAGELDTPLLLRAAMLEVEALRARSWPDHGETSRMLGRITSGETASVEVRGPGVLTLRTRVLMEDKPYQRYALWLDRDGRPQGEHQIFTTEDELGAPGWGWPRSVAIEVPPGLHEFGYRLTARDDLAVVDVEAVVEPARPTLQSFLLTLPRSRSLAKRGTLGPVGALEIAHLTGETDPVPLARQLLGGAADELARARLIEHLEDSNEAARLYVDKPITPMTALAMARRWQDRRDIDPALLLEAAWQLPADPSLLADIGGLPRVQLTDGQVATIQLPEPAIEGRFPVLRMEAADTVLYRVDGAARQGRGDLEEALSPGSHRVEVEQGRLILLDAALIEGGEPVRDKAVGSLPNRWLLPDAGAPGEVEVLVFGPGGRLVVSADDGQVRELEARPDTGGEPGLTQAVLPIGPSANELRIEGPKGTMVGVALRRNTVEQHPAVPGPWPDPLEYFWDASRALVDQPDPGVRAELRLRRAASYHVLGLVVSSQREARAVAAMPMATPEQRAVGMALYRNTVPPVHTAEFPGPVTVDAALAWAQVPHREAHGCEDLVRIADDLLPPVSWPVHEAASRCYLERGSVVEAWIQAEHAGPLGRVARLKAADAGDWQPITRVDLDGGTFPRRVLRQPPDLSDGLAAYLRELSLGVPWTHSSYSVIRNEKQAELEFEGQGSLQLQFVCRDESFAVEAPPCEFTLAVDGDARDLSVPDSTHQPLIVALPRGKHQIEAGPLMEPGQALAVRASLDGQLLPPQSEFTVHRLGYQGLVATVAGPSLLRLRAHEHGPVQVHVGDRTIQVEDEAVLPISALGPVRIQVKGAPEATITLSRLHLCAKPEEEIGPLPRSLDHNLPLPSATAATDRWMREVAAPAQQLVVPMERGGTLTGSLTAGDDSTGVRDTTRHYRYLGAGAGWYQRLDGQPHWFSVEADGRAGPDGPPGTTIGGQWAWVPSRHQVRVQAEVAGSGGAGHASSRATWRWVRRLGPWWSVQPFAHLHLGWWTDAPGETVDPTAWNAYAAQHWFGTDLGLHADWRPLRDLRLRLYTELDGNPNMTPDGVHFGLRTDAMVWDSCWLKLTPQATIRFADDSRQSGYVRPSLRGGLSTSWYSSQRLRWVVHGDASWYPLEGSVEGLLGLDIQYSHARGLRDQSPFDQVFTSALDLPLEDR